MFANLRAFDQKIMIRHQGCFVDSLTDQRENRAVTGNEVLEVAAAQNGGAGIEQLFRRLIDEADFAIPIRNDDRTSNCIKHASRVHPVSFAKSKSHSKFPR